MDGLMPAHVFSGLNDYCERKCSLIDEFEQSARELFESTGLSAVWITVTSNCQAETLCEPHVANYIDFSIDL